MSEQPTATPLTATATTEPITLPPTPAQIDELIVQYEEQDRVADESRAIADGLKDRLIQLVRAHGSIPDAAQQSWRIEGVHSTATVTVGVTKTIREEHVLSLWRYMNEHSLADYFHRMFKTSTRYTLIDGAGDVLRGIDLGVRTRDKVLALFGMCLDVKDKKPTLTVKAVKPVKPARKPRAAKAVA